MKIENARIIFLPLIFFLTTGLCITTNDFHSPLALGKGRKLVGMGISGALSRGTLDFYSEEIEIYARFGVSNRIDFDLKLYASGGRENISRGFGIYGGGKVEILKSQVLDVSGNIGLSYSRCKIIEPSRHEMGHVFALYTSILVGKEYLFVGYKSAAELRDFLGGQLALSQEISFMMGGSFGDKIRFIPELTYCPEGPSTDLYDESPIFVVGTSIQYCF
jgi:hypothetical protein